MSELIHLIQANSGPLWQIGVSDGAGGLVTLDGNYSCRLYVATANPIINRLVTSITGNRYQVQLTGDESALLSVGTHIVTVEIENDTVGFRREKHYTFRVEAQQYSA